MRRRGFGILWMVLATALALATVAIAADDKGVD
jgi:hypothetical protein